MKIIVFTFALFTVFSNIASASVSKINSQANFSAAGTITQNTNFDTMSNFVSLSNPHTIGDLTFLSGSNLVVGSNTSYNPVRSVLAYNYWSPLPGSITGTHDLFGFDLGYLGQQSDISVNLSTNMGNYSFLVHNPIIASAGLQFMGFQADVGELFTGFSLASAIGDGSAPVITDIQLGNAGTAVPEPDIYATLLTGLGLMGFMLRRRRKA